VLLTSDGERLLQTAFGLGDLRPAELSQAVDVFGKQ
jgi:hypothetical protein